MSDMTRLAATINAGATYFAVVFVFGFAMGVLRVFVLEPELGPLGSVALELPAMLFASWMACSVLVDWFEVDTSFGVRATMGGVAFALLLLAEAGLAVATGRSLSQHFATFGDTAVQLGLMGQIVFALFPLIQGAWPKMRRS